MRAPSFKGLRDDASRPRSRRGSRRRDAGRTEASPRPTSGPDGPEALFDEVERLPDGALSV